MFKNSRVTQDCRLRCSQGKLESAAEMFAVAGVACVVCSEACSRRRQRLSPPEAALQLQLQIQRGQEEG